MTKKGLINVCITNMNALRQMIFAREYGVEKVRELEALDSAIAALEAIRDKRVPLVSDSRLARIFESWLENEEDYRPQYVVAEDLVNAGATEEELRFLGFEKEEEK